RREEGSGQHDILDVASRDPELFSEKCVINLVVAGGLGRKVDLPDLISVGLIGKGKLHNELEATGKGLIHVLAQIRRQDRHAIVLPVPEGPAKRALAPFPRDSLRPNPHSLNTRWRWTTC